MKNLKIKDIMFLISYTVFLLVFLSNLTGVFSFIKSGLSVVSPFIIAIFIAFVVNIPLKRIEPFLSKKIKSNFRRSLAIMLAFLSILFFLATIIVFLVPEINSSVKTLSDIFPNYLKSLEESILNIAISFNLPVNVINQISNNFDKIVDFFASYVLDVIPKILSATLNIANSTINFFIGFIASFYLLYSKENMILGLKKILKAIFPEKTTKYLLYVGEITNKTFEAFIVGQCAESVILGTLCVIGLVVLKIEYAVLIGVIIGISSLIPIFGSILGTIPCVFILFAINPRQAVIFLVFIFILQQLEGDIIYPRVVGKSIGISGLWVMFAMIVGGSVAGVAGLIIGVPTFAVFYTLFKEWIDYKLSKKEV